MNTELRKQPRLWLPLDETGAVMVERVVAFGRSDLAATRRLLAATPLTHVVDLTGAKRRRSLLVLDSGHVVLSALTVGQLEHMLS